ncbi:MAG: hypothetical protein AAGG01_02095 [Planctomycetota bacterium]
MKALRSSLLAAGLAPGLALSLAAGAAAQSTILGIDLRNGEIFTSETVDFVNNYFQLSQEARDLYGLDWTTDGATLYAVDDDTLEVVTIDPVSGLTTPTGTVVTGTGITGLTGLTSAPDGSTWYLSDYDGADSYLFEGDIVTGVFSQIGFINDGIIIDIAMDANGDLYGMSISDDSLYSIDLNTGLGTVIGPTGLNANFAQGMDFDPSTGELFAPIYTGGGTGQFCTLDLTTGLATQLEDTFPLNAEMEIAIRPDFVATIGMPYCTAAPNSTGVPAVISATGSDDVADNDVLLMAESLPANAFGFFITSQTQGFVMMPGGSSGNLCLGGEVGRYVGSGQIQNSGPGGAFSLQIDLTMVPQPMGPVAAVAGDTWNFQTWYRDSSPAGPTSNFTNGLQIDF